MVPYLKIRDPMGCRYHDSTIKILVHSIVHNDIQRRINSASRKLSVCVCVFVNQGNTNNNCYTRREME